MEHNVLINAADEESDMESFLCKQSPSGRDYRLRWSIFHAIPDQYCYATAVGQAWVGQSIDVEKLTVGSAERSQVVLTIVLKADSISDAVDRSRQLLFTLIDRAKIEQPQSLALVAAEEQVISGRGQEAAWWMACGTH